MKMKRLGSAIGAAALCVACVGGGLLVGCQGAQPEHVDETIVEQESEPVFDEPFYIALVGNDGRTGTVEIDQAMYADGSARSDVTMLLRVDPVNFTLTTITVPRDTATTYDGTQIKFNMAYQYGGIDAMKDQVKSLTGVEPRYYFDLGFVTFEKFIDALGGVNVNVPANMSLQDIVSGENISLAAGQQDLDGAQSLVLARSRKLYGGYQDAIRQIQNRNIVEAGISKVLADPALAETAVSAMMEFAETDMTEKELSVLVNMFCENADKVTFYDGTGPYVGDIDPADGMWYTTRDEATWAQVIAAVDAGEDPAGIVADPEFILQ